MGRFDDNQIAAIKHNKGPMMVVAGPGSGKTTVITYRVKNLVEKFNVNPSNILVITYTRYAAEEMKTRFKNIMPYISDVNFGTIHSIFFRILKAAYHYKNSDIFMESEKYMLLRNIINDNKMNYDGQEDFIRNIISEISYVKCENIRLYEYTSKNMHKDDFIKIFELYEKYLSENNKIDFDDMLVYTYELLKTRKDILRNWQNVFEYILVDEFQDINHIQYEAVKLLAEKNKNIFVVGDDDQSVYSFRGANPDIMKNFKKDYPEADIVNMSINYRCSRDIVCCADRIIKNNKNRLDKKIVSAYNGVKCERVHVIPVNEQKEEYGDIISRINALSENGVPFSQMAVLLRTNMESGGLASKLAEYNIPFKVKDSIQNIFSHFISRNIMDYIKIACGDRSRSRLLAIINRPNRYIGRDALTEETIEPEALREYYKDKPRIQNNINVFENDLERIKKLKPYAAINYIRRACGYDEYIKEYANYRGMDKNDFFDLMDDLMESAREFESFDEWFSYIDNYNEMIQEIDKRDISYGEAVTIATMHSSKGLEFDYVFILNAVEGIIPHKKSDAESDIEEERRIFYVAVTRARYGLYVYTPNIIYGKKVAASRFVREMLIDRDILKEGNKIVHKIYGMGIITSVDDRRICVKFDGENTFKTLSIEYTMNNGLISVSDGN